MQVGARTALWSGGAKMPTARDYVQDGLIAMWDGIENAGWGVHNPNATVWKDLVGNRDLDVNPLYGSFLYDCFNSNGAGPGAAINTSGSFLSKSNECSIEIVLSVSAQKPEQAIFSAASNGLQGRIIWFYKNGIGWGYYGRSTPYVLESRKAFSATFSSNEDVASKTYQDGIEYVADSTVDYFTLLTGDISVSSSPSYFFRGKIFSIRIYNRKIEHGVITHNYAIDKARFGLS